MLSVAILILGEFLPCFNVISSLRTEAGRIYDKTDPELNTFVSHKGKRGNSPANPFKAAAAHTHAVHLYAVQLLNLHDWCSVQSEHLIKRHLQSGLHVPVTYQYFTTPANAISAAIYNRGLQTAETQSIHTLFMATKAWKHVALLVLKESWKTVKAGQSIYFSASVRRVCVSLIGCCVLWRK